MTSQWHYYEDGEKQGPVSSEILRDLINTGLLSLDDYVRRDDEEEWRPVHSIEGLFRQDETPLSREQLEAQVSEVSQTDDVWFMLQNDVQCGPFNFREMKELIRMGELHPKDQVWNEALEMWKPAAEIDEFQFPSESPFPAQEHLAPNNPPDVVELKSSSTQGPSTTDEVNEVPQREDTSSSPTISIDTSQPVEAAEKSTGFTWIELLAVIGGALILFWIMEWYTFLIWTARSCLAVTLFLMVLSFLTDSGHSDETKGDNEMQAWRVLLIVPALFFAWASFRTWGDLPGGVPKEKLYLASVVLEFSATEKDVPQLADAMKGHGSAFVIGESGQKLRLMTNAHCLGVIELLQAASLTENQRVDVETYDLKVTFPSGKQKSVERIALISGEDLDVAQLEVDASGLSEGTDYLTLPYGGEVTEKLDIAPGNEVIAVGTPIFQEFQGSQSFGRIGALRDSIEGYSGSWIQHDAKITGGNSGGPLLLVKDDLAYWVGINTLGVPDSQISLALSADSAMSADYKWNDATPVGVANLIRNEIGVDAVGRYQPPKPSELRDLFPNESQSGRYRLGWLQTMAAIVGFWIIIIQPMIEKMKPFDSSTPGQKRVRALILITVVFCFYLWMVFYGYSYAFQPPELESLQSSE